MKQTIVPTRWEIIFHLYVWGVVVIIGIIALVDLACLLLVTVALHTTTLGEEQIAGCVMLIVIGAWLVGSLLGSWLHRRHLKHSSYLFPVKKIKLANLSAIVYTTVLYFVIIVVF